YAELEMVAYIVFHIVVVKYQRRMQQPVKSNTERIIPFSEQCVLVIRSYRCLRSIKSPVIILYYRVHPKRFVKREREFSLERTHIHPLIWSALYSCDTGKLYLITYEPEAPAAVAADG